MQSAAGNRKLHDSACPVSVVKPRTPLAFMPSSWLPSRSLSCWMVPDERSIVCQFCPDDIGTSVNGTSHAAPQLRNCAVSKAQHRIAKRLCAPCSSCYTCARNREAGKLDDFRNCQFAFAYADPSNLDSSLVSALSSPNSLSSGSKSCSSSPARHAELAASRKA